MATNFSKASDSALIEKIGENWKFIYYLFLGWSEIHISLNDTVYIWNVNDIWLLLHPINKYLLNLQFPLFFSNSVYTQWTVVLFLQLLNSCPERLCYGIGQTQRKDDSFVSTLTIYNELFVYEDNTVQYLAPKKEK